MVVYSSLCADLSAEFLDFLPGTIEEKLLTLQDQLGEHFPDIILQYLCGEEQNIVQIKGSWLDVQNIHEVLEAWMKNGDVNESGAEDSFAERIEGITNGVFFDEEKQACEDQVVEPLSEIKHVENVEKQDGVPAAENDVGSFGKENQGETATPDAITEQPDITDATVSEIQDEQTVVQSPEKRIKLETPDEGSDATSSVVRDEKTEDETPTAPALITRSGRVVKRTYAAMIKERVSDLSTLNEEDLLDINNDQEFIPTEEAIAGIETDDEVLNEITQAFCDASATAGESDSEVVVKLDKRGRKKKALKTIPSSEVEAYLDVSVEKSHGRDNVVCCLCDYKTTAKRHLKAHLQRCHVAAANTCKLCKKKYALAKDLRAHMKVHFPKYKCPKCNRKFPTKSVLGLHMQRYHSVSGEAKRLKKLMDGPIKCDDCDYIAENEKYLKDHIGRTHSKKAFICEICHKAFGLKKDLMTHVKTRHEDQFHYCEECGKALKSKHALRNHIDVIHRGLKNTYSKTYVCDHCGVLCRSKTHYNEHMNKEHLHVKPFGCPLCSMAFYTNSSLKVHLNAHSDERKYVCKQCGKGFKASNSLRVHELTHLEYSQRPHACTTCNKTFAQKGALQRHMRIHSGEKPYKCKLCESAFSDYSILRRHMLGVHKVNSKDLCQRDDLTGNRGGPKSSDLVKVQDIAKYRKIVRVPTPGDSQTIEVKTFNADELALLRGHVERVEDIKLEEGFKINIGGGGDPGNGSVDSSHLVATSVFATPIEDVTVTASPASHDIKYVIATPGDDGASDFATSAVSQTGSSSSPSQTGNAVSIGGSGGGTGYRVIHPAVASGVSMAATPIALSHDQLISQMASGVVAQQQFSAASSAQLGDVVHLSGGDATPMASGAEVISSGAVSMEPVDGEISSYTHMPAFTVQHLTGADGQNIAIQILQPAAQES